METELDRAKMSWAESQIAADAGNERCLAAAYVMLST